MKRILLLSEKFPPSEPCSCEICTGYCIRSGWWTVEETERALNAGLGNRMMLELYLQLKIGVLSPAFAGCEGGIALQEFSHAGCNFLKNGLCELFGTGLEPLECRFCHHDRKGQGAICHAALEKEWKTPAGQALVFKWISSAGLLKGTNESLCCF